MHTSGSFRLRVLGIGLILSVALAVAACGSSSSGGKAAAQSGGGAQHASTKLTMAVGTQADALDFAPLWVAQQKGYFTDEGLDIDFVRLESSTPAMSAVLSGDADVMAGGASPLVTSVSQGQDVQAFGPLSTALPWAMYVRKDVAAERHLDPGAPLEQKIRALKGLRFGASGPGSGFDTGTRYLLQKYGGLDPNQDVQITTLGGAKTAAALERGQIDAAVMSPPVAFQSMATGKIEQYIDLPREVPAFQQQYNQGLVAKKDYIEAHPDVIDAVAKALSRAIDDLNNDTDATEALLRKKVYSSLPPDVWKGSFEAALEAVPKDFSITHEQVTNLLNVGKQVTGKDLALTYGDLVTTKFFKQAG